MAVINSELPQEYLICDFSCPSPEKPNTLYLKLVGIPSSQNRTITKKIDFCNYDENDAAYKENWEVDYDRLVGPFFSTIADEKEIDNVRDNPVSMRREEHIEVEDQVGKFVPLPNDNIDAMEKEIFIMRFCREG